MVDSRETHWGQTYTHITHIHLLSLMLWHIHTSLTASAAVCPSPSITFICSSSVMAVKFFMIFVNLFIYRSLIDLNLCQWRRKCTSVSFSPVSQWAYTMCSLGNQLFLCLPVLMASLCSLSLYTWSGFVSALCLWYSVDILPIHNLI